MCHGSNVLMRHSLTSSKSKGRRDSGLRGVTDIISGNSVMDERILFALLNPRISSLVNRITVGNRKEGNTDDCCDTVSAVQ